MSKLESFKVQIPLTESQAVPVSLWLERFHAKAVHTWSTPELNCHFFTIHPADFPNLLLQAQPQDCTELEFYRIRKQGALAISQALKNKKSKLSSELHAMVTDSLSGLRPTEFTEDTSLEIRLPDNI
jgi:hypothetical protein